VLQAKHVAQLVLQDAEQVDSVPLALIAGPEELAVIDRRGRSAWPQGEARRRAVLRVRERREPVQTERRLGALA
jgi:hypothetical protein